MKKTPLKQRGKKGKAPNKKKRFSMWKNNVGIKEKKILFFFKKKKTIQTLEAKAHI